MSSERSPSRALSAGELAAARQLADDRWRALHGSPPVTAERNELLRVLTLSLAGVCFGLALTYPEFAELDGELQAAGIGFLIAIPSGVLSWALFRAELGERFDLRFTMPCAVVATTAGAFGILFYVWHFDVWAGRIFAVVFAVCSGVAWASIVAEQRKRDQITQLRVQALADDDSVEELIRAPHRSFGLPDEAVSYPLGDRRYPRISGVQFVMYYGPDGNPAYRLPDPNSYPRRVRRRRARTPAELTALLEDLGVDRSGTPPAAS